jgi:hypothetical protein
LLAVEDSNFTRFIAGFRRVSLLPPKSGASARREWPAGDAPPATQFSANPLPNGPSFKHFAIFKNPINTRTAHEFIQHQQHQ